MMQINLKKMNASDADRKLVTAEKLRKQVIGGC